MTINDQTTSAPATVSATEPRTAQVAEIVDKSRFLGLPALAAAFTALALIFDGFDIQAAGFVAPELIDEWGITRGDLGPVLAAALIGMGLGAVLMGPVGDKHGRRSALIGSMMMVAVGALLSAFADTPQELTLYRFITGLGLGGSLPNATALLVELSPLAMRHLTVSVAIVGVPIGGIIGAEAAAQLMPLFGWRSVFIAGAVLPLALALTMWLWMPESPSFLARRPERAGELAGMMNRLAGALVYRPGDHFLVAEPQSGVENAGLRALLAPLYRTDTLLLWSAFFVSMFSAYAFFSWLPTVLAGIGLPVSVALRCALVYNLGGVVGALVMGSIMNRFGSRPILLSMAFLGVLATASLAGLPASLYRATDIGPLLLITAVAGSAMLGMQVGLYSLAAHTYPTWMRSTGVGAAVGVGRAGGIMSAFAGGIVGVIGQGVTPFFATICAVFVLLAVILPCFGRHIPSAAAAALVPKRLADTHAVGAADQTN